MQISPRYDGPPVLELHIALDDVAQPLLRQRRRLGDSLAMLDVEQWAAPSRCDGWSVQDVVTHLIGTNQFWALSFGAGQKGEPTRFLASFDPVATPAQMVDALRTMSTDEVLDRYVRTTEDLAAVIDTFDDADWSLLAEAPPGHVATRVVALHALWDAWIHERDIVLPLDLAPVVEPDEVAACLYYAAAIGPCFYVSTDSTRRGELTVAATEPDVAFVVRVGSTVTITDPPAADGAARLEGDAVALVEGLTYRAPLAHDLDESDAWLLAGLGEVFDQSDA